jgi:RHS repeat-associated protein
MPTIDGWARALEHGMTEYLWDPIEDNVIGEYDQGETVAEYTTEPALDGSIITQHRGASTSVYHADAQGSTLSLTDQNAGVTDTYAYNAFGEQAERSGATINRFEYIGLRGYYTDPETSNTNVRSRVYQPSLARWLASDPAGFFDGSNKYQYVHNIPTSLADPSGLLSQASMIIDGHNFHVPAIDWSFSDGCASFSWLTRWTLLAVERDGYIIQRVCPEIHARCCDGTRPKPYTPAVKVANRSINGTTCTACYFEIWRVLDGTIFADKVFGKPSALTGYDSWDTFGLQGFHSCPHRGKPGKGVGCMIGPPVFKPALPSCTRGTNTQTGTASFVPKLAWDADREAGVVKNKFNVGPRGVRNAGWLYSACEDKQLMVWFTRITAGRRSTSKSVSRQWDCCTDCDDSVGVFECVLDGDVVTK